jgi:hypothetical protein
MDGAQFRRRAHVGAPLIADDLVGDAEFFQKPQHALRAGIVEMMDGDHGDFPWDRRLGAAPGGASRLPESRDLSAPGDITAVLLTKVTG